MKIYFTQLVVVLGLKFVNICLGFKCLPPVDVYTGRMLSKKHISKEHVIPKRFFRNKDHANDVVNIVPCDRTVNQLRSDYKFGHLSSDEISLPDSGMTHVFNHYHDFSGYLNRRTRTFYPGDDADFGMIGRSIAEMLRKYPYLYSNIFDIVENPSVLAIWCSYPMSDFEKVRNKKMFLDNLKNKLYSNSEEP